MACPERSRSTPAKCSRMWPFATYEGYKPFRMCVYKKGWGEGVLWRGPQAAGGRGGGNRGWPLGPPRCGQARLGGPAPTCRVWTVIYRPLTIAYLLSTVDCCPLTVSRFRAAAILAIFHRTSTPG